jgi:hypothetical protein
VCCFAARAGVKGENQFSRGGKRYGKINSSREKKVQEKEKDVKDGSSHVLLYAVLARRSENNNGGSQ